MAAIYRPQRIAAVAVYRQHRGVAPTPPPPPPPPAPAPQPTTNGILPIAIGMTLSGEPVLLV